MFEVGVGVGGYNLPLNGLQRGRVVLCDVI